MAERLYRLLLRLLPKWFRDEFAAEMVTVFRAQCASATKDGTWALAALWLKSIRGLIALSARIHVDSLVQDTRYASRSLSRTRAFTVAAVGTLALGLGPTLVIANLLYQVVLAPLPFTQPERLVSMWHGDAEKNRHEFPLSLPNFVDYQSRQDQFVALAAHTGTSVAFVGNGAPRQLRGVLTTPDLFDVLDINPVIGRRFTAEDSKPGAPRVIIIGASFWRSEFNRRPDIVGQSVRVDGDLAEIIGVLPADMPFPTGSDTAWLPLTIDLERAMRGNHYLSATGRLREGVTISGAMAALNNIAQALQTEHPLLSGGPVELKSLKEQLNGDTPRLVIILAGAIGAVLLLACTNVASLITVRSSLRAGELAVRAAVGATAPRLRRQLLVEHLLLAGAGGVLAIIIAVPMHRLLVRYKLLQLPPTTQEAIGWIGFASLAVLIVAIGTAFALLTARQLARTDTAATLLASIRQTGTRRTLRLRQALVATEVAAALLLVVVGGLMVRTALQVARVEPGFRTENVLTFGVVLPEPAYADVNTRLQFVERVLTELQALPGVHSAAMAAFAPMGDIRSQRRYRIPGRPDPPAGELALAIELPVGPGYFDVMGIRVLDGRAIDARDVVDSPRVIMVSETFAREVFPGERAVGKLVGFYSGRPGVPPGPPSEIIGVVSDVRQTGVVNKPMQHMYVPYAHRTWIFASFFIRTTADPAALAPMVQRVVNQVDPLRPVRDVKSTAEIVQGSTARQRAITWMLLALAAIALVLAAVGLYGVSATVAASRTRELAIRAAIGANPASLRRLVLAQALAAALVGVAVGGVASLVATRGVASLLYEVSPRDPLTFTLTAVLLLAVAALAAYIPARRALARNVAEILRAEAS